MVDESFVPSTHGPRVLYLRLSDLRKEEEFIYKSSQKRHKAFCSVVIYLHYKLAYTRRHFFQNKIRSTQSCRNYVLFTLKRRSHYHFTRLNPKKKGTLQFCLPALQGIHRHPMQKEFFRSTQGFLRAVLSISFSV